jgi:hypothetical protein
MVVEVMAKEKFEYCQTCGVAENPECTKCGKVFWHREMGAYLNGGNGSGVVKHLCPKCAKGK